MPVRRARPVSGHVGLLTRCAALRSVRPTRGAGPDRGGLRGGRPQPPADVTLIAVTKTCPGLRRPAAQRPRRDRHRREPGPGGGAQGRRVRRAGPQRCTWHFVGQLQVNKAASVVSYADVIHSVDRLRLVSALGSRAAAAGRSVTCLVQVSLDERSGRRGRRGRRRPGDGRSADAIAARGGPRPRRRDGRRAARRPRRPRVREARRVVAAVSASAHPGAAMISAGHERRSGAGD